MRRNLTLATLFALAALVVALGGLSFTAKVSEFQPLGFEAERQGEVWRVRDIPAPETGLQQGDLLLTIGGNLPASPQEMRERLTDRSQTELLVQRGDRLVEVSYGRPSLEIDVVYLMLAFIGLLYLIIGLYTLLRAQAPRVGLFTTWCLASAAIYLFTATPPYDTSAERVLYICEIVARLVLPALTLHFFLTFPRPISPAKWLRRTIPFLYLPGAVLLALQVDLIYLGGRFFTGAPSLETIALLDQLTLVQLMIYVPLAVTVLVLQLVRTGHGVESRQVLWVTLGMIGGYLPFLALYVVPFVLGYQAPRLLQAAVVLPLGLVPLSFAYAILRYRLWDIAIIVRDITTYALTLVLGLIGFSLLNLAIDRGIPEDLSVTRYLLTFIAGLTVAGLLIPTRQAIGSTLQRFHYRGNFSRRRALTQFGRDLLHERNLESLSTSLLRELDEGLDLDRSNLYLVEGDRLVPVLDEEGGAITLPLLGLGTRVWEQDYEHLTAISLPESPLESSQHLFLNGYRYAFPLSIRERRIGIVVTGYKSDQVPLNSDDLILVRQLLNQASLAIENAQLLEQLQRQLTEVLELKQFNEEIIESTPAGIAAFDSSDRVVTANLAFAALAGMERNAVRRKQLPELLPLERIPSVDEGVVNSSWKDAQGRERHFQASVASFLGSASDMRVLVIHDVTERVKMERRLEEQERLAAIGVMAAGVAHEVNTPLTGISSYAQMLLSQTPEEDPRHDTLRKVERQTFRAARIVNSLLEFARRRDVAPQPVNLVAVLEECHELLEERLGASNVKLSIESPQSPAFASSTDSEMHQVFTNLLLNAVDAMQPEGGVVRVTVTPRGQFVDVEVADEGTGISEDNLGQVFQPFFSTKTDAGGTGLGLSISHEIVRRHGGELTVRNLDRGGCAFTARLLRYGKSDDDGDPSKDAQSHDPQGFRA